MSPHLRIEVAMNIKRILFPTDFSHDNRVALKLASTLAAESHARLYIVHVHDIRNTSTATGEADLMVASALHEERREAWERLAKIAPSVPTVQYEHELLTGTPAVELLQFAQSMQIDLIVMSSHGRNGLRRLLMGSIAEGTMRKANCPVMVVKQPAGRREPKRNVVMHAVHR
jgi:universal stress protein A